MCEMIWSGDRKMWLYLYYAALYPPVYLFQVPGWQQPSCVSSWLVQCCWSLAAQFINPTTGPYHWCCGTGWVSGCADKKKNIIFVSFTVLVLLFIEAALFLNSENQKWTNLDLNSQTASVQKGEHLLHQSLESNSHDNTWCIYPCNCSHFSEGESKKQKTRLPRNLNWLQHCWNTNLTQPVMWQSCAQAAPYSYTYDLKVAHLNSTVAGKYPSGEVKNKKHFLFSLINSG